MLGHGRSRDGGVGLRLAGAVVACLVLAIGPAAAEGAEAVGLRLSTHECFDRPYGAQMVCNATDFEFPQAWTAEGRFVRLTNQQEQARYLRRTDVLSTGNTTEPEDFRRTNPDAAALRAQRDTGGSVAAYARTTPSWYGLISWRQRLELLRARYPASASECDNRLTPLQPMPPNAGEQEYLAAMPAVNAHLDCVWNYRRQQREPQNEEAPPQ